MLKFKQKGVDVKMMKKDTRERFTLRLPENLLEKIRKQAEASGVSTNAMILEILRHWKKSDNH